MGDESYNSQKRKSDEYEGMSFSSPPGLKSAIDHVVSHSPPNTPLDLIYETLLKAPIKTVVRDMYMCKSVTSLVRHPKFISDYSKLNAYRRLFLYHVVHCVGFSNRIDTGFEIQGFKADSYTLLHDDSAVSEYCKIVFPVALNEKLINPCFRVVGTCNGLVLLADDLRDYGTLVIWNPSIRRYVILPEPAVRSSSTQGRYFWSLGLGHDAVGKDHKVVRLTDHVDNYVDDCRTFCQVFSLAKGTWGELRCLPGFFVPQRFCPIFVKGALHWISIPLIKGNDYQRYFISTMDVAGESFGQMELPVSCNSEDNVDLKLSLSGDRKSLALFVTTLRYGPDVSLSIWVIEEYDKKAWKRLDVLGPQGPQEYTPTAYCIRTSGEVIVEIDPNYVVSFNVVTKEYKRLGIYGSPIYSVDCFEESLVLLDREDAVSY